MTNEDDDSTLSNHDCDSIDITLILLIYIYIIYHGPCEKLK